MSLRGMGALVVVGTSSAKWRIPSLLLLGAIIQMLDFLIDNIFVQFEFGRRVYQQMIGIPMGMNCASLLADLFLFAFKRQTSFKDFSRIKIFFFKPDH